MILGFLGYGEDSFFHSGTNKWIEPNANDRFPNIGVWGPNSNAVYRRLYPNDPFVMLVTKDPNLEFANRCDFIIFQSSTGQDPLFLEHCDKIEVPIIHWQHGGYENMVQLSYGAVLRNKQCMDKCDLVVTTDHRYVSLYKTWTKTPVIYCPLPYPVNYALKTLSKSVDIEYDLFIPYGINMTYNNRRNGYVMSAVADKIITNVESFNNCLMIDSGNTDKSCDFLQQMGFQNITIIDRKKYSEYLLSLSRCRVIINLDRHMACGKVAIDAALARKPVIMSNRIPYAQYIYSGIKLQDPFDVDAALATAELIQRGGWEQSWIDMAFNRAQDFSMENVGKILEEAVGNLKFN